MGACTGELVLNTSLRSIWEVEVTGIGNSSATDCKREHVIDDTLDFDLNSRVNVNVIY